MEKLSPKKVKSMLEKKGMELTAGRGHDSIRIYAQNGKHSCRKLFGKKLKTKNEIKS
jgi:hypothetical protein